MASSSELLKQILSSLREPERLSNHPWALSMNASANQKIGSPKPGELLIAKVSTTFRKMTPSGPPRQGKRLDTRWGAFGILAAQYFGPYLLDRPFPASLREAWESIDSSILLFVFGRTDGLREAEIAKYRFAGNESEAAPNSTLSDWHRKGVEQLSEMVELDIQRLNSGQSVKHSYRETLKKPAGALGLLVLLISIFLGWKGWQFYHHVLVIEQKMESLETYLKPAPKLEQIPEIAGKVHELRIDIDALQGEAQPYLWVAPYSGWIPKYGGTLSQSKDLLSLAQNLSTAADEGLTAITPAIETTLKNDQPLEVMDLVLQLQATSPQLLNAQISLAQAQAARERIDPESLLPRIKNVVTNRIDPLFESIAGAFPMEDALSLIRIAPKLLGSGKTGPQTYLILMQNEDELRPTGGFLTAAGSAVVKDGKLISINIESSDLVDDPSKPYPIPPWQFKEFMNIEVLLFRDSNWYTDFPTTASSAEYFYSYGRASSSDGVIAIDMHVIVRLLETLGPVRVDGVSNLITKDNVEDYLRSAEEAPPKGVKKGEWDRKQFIGELAHPLLEKILNARGQTWTKLVPVLVELLNEKHILLQFDDEEATNLLERRNWDGAVRTAQNSDYFMAVDTNMGYNKSNARMNTDIEYSVDLTNANSPTGHLLIRETNESKVDVPCEPQATTRFLLPASFPGQIREPIYNMDECHWGYLRVYTPSGTKLLHSNPQEIPAESTWLGELIPARTDDLGDEGIPNVQAFGSMVLTPTHQSTLTEYEYTLPVDVSKYDDATKVWTYRLRVQKQPGIDVEPLKLLLHLPDGAQVVSSSIPFSENAGLWTAQLDLRQDLIIEVHFSVQP